MKGSILAKESKSLPLSKKQAWLLQLGGYCFIRHCFHPSRDQRMKEWPCVQPQYHLCMFSLVVSEAPLACDLLKQAHSLNGPIVMDTMMATCFAVRVQRSRSCPKFLWPSCFVLPG
jgi:hypothetical protein